MRFTDRISYAYNLLFKHSLHTIAYIITNNISQIKNKETFIWYDKYKH